jgi:two-component system, LytTR family, sensor kinase
MWRPDYKKIGFDDRLVSLIMIPVTAFFIPIVFFGIRIGRTPEYDWRMFVTTIITTSVIWIGNRYILIWARTRYPQFPKVKKRLWVQSLVMLGFTLLATNTLGYYLHGFCGLGDTANYPGRSLADVVINSNNAAFFCSITVAAIYESKYLSKKLMESLEEQEMLKRENLHAQLNALKTQVNPHFLFNNLNTLASLIPEDPKQAVAFVQQLSKVYRHILEVKDEKSISLKDELEVLEAYAFLLKTRFGNNLTIDIAVPAEKMKHNIVPLSLQLLMENAIKHNVVSMSKPLRIDVYSVNGSLVVRNNLQKKNQLSESTGIGLDNIRNRYRLLGDRQVMVTENENSFTVSIPLIATG